MSEATISPTTSRTPKRIHRPLAVGNLHQAGPNAGHGACLSAWRGRGEDTERSRVLDIARGAPWPERYTARTLRNSFLDRWRGREADLERDNGAKADYRNAADRGDLSVVPVWASEAIDLITDVPPAAELVALIAADAENALLQASPMAT